MDRTKETKKERARGKVKRQSAAFGVLQRVGRSFMLPVSVVSLINYTAAGHLPQADFAPILIPCVVGGLAGALLLDRVNTTALQRLFALIVIWSGATMIFF